MITRYLKRYSIVMAACMWVVSCGSSTSIFSDFLSEERFMDQLQARMPELDLPEAVLQQKLLDDAGTNMHYAYELNNYRPIWFDNSGPKDEVFDLVRSLNALWDEGINPGVYKVGYLQRVLNGLENRSEGARFPLDSLIAWDTIFTKTYLQAALDLQMGKGNLREADQQWFLPNDETFSGAAYLVTQLRHPTAFPAFDTFKPQIRMYALMKDAAAFWRDKKKDRAFLNRYYAFKQYGDTSAGRALVRQQLMQSGVEDSSSAYLYSSFQYAHQLPVTGKLDSVTKAVLQLPPDYYLSRLLLNMERLRCLPRQLGHEYLWVNIPQMDLSYQLAQQQILYSRVIVGCRDTQTPGLKGLLRSIIFNPNEVVVTSSLAEIGSGIHQTDVAYLRHKGMMAVNAAGKVATDQVSPENFRQFDYHKLPRASHASGNVRFSFPNKQGIYLQDSPYAGKFSEPERMTSSGSVSVQRPYDLAQLVLTDQGFRRDNMRKIIRSKRTHTLAINRELPVYLVYLSVGMDSLAKDIRYLQDMYCRDSTALAVWGY